MDLTISAAHNDARLEGTRVFLDTGSVNAKIKIYNGTRPETNDGPITDQLLLVEIALDKPCGTVSAGVLTLSSNTLPMIANSGVATWARVVNGDGVQAFDCDVGDTASTAHIKLENTTLLAGGRVALISAALG